MRYTLNCKSCSKHIGDFEINPDLLPTLILQHHISGTHSGIHPLEILPLLEGDVEVRLTCMQPACRNFGILEVYKVPPYAVSAVVIAFHSKNEGHIIKLELNGKEILPIT